MSDAPPLLSDAEIRDALRELEGWSLEDGALARTFTFRDFVAAFAFMTACAIEAEKADHHPDWSNVYRTVEVRLSTHEAGGITARDTALAATMSRLAAA